VGEEGYVGLDVVRAARICSAGHGGQILASETTRALVGNDLPDGVSVRDLGNQRLKDVQYEHIYELSLDEGREGFPPLKAEGSGRADAMAERFEQRIENYVERMLEDAFTGSGELQAHKLAKSGLGLALAGLVVVVLLVAAIVAIVLLVKLAL
jgi:hypothetical protein